MPRIDKKHHFLTALIIQRRVIVTLIIRDFKSRYLSSFLGLPWAFIQPSTYVFIIWFAFTYGLRTGTTETGVPFAPWLLAALIPWMFISQTMIVSCMAIPEYAYLIKKTHFNVSLIPVVKVLSGMIVHVIMIGIIIIIMTFSFGFPVTIYWIQVFYYLFATFLLLTGIAWFVSAVNVFIKDMAHIVNIITSMLFWATPIVWPFTKLHGNMKYLALLNPFFYITEGYRYTFIEGQWFFNFPEMNIYFWTVTSVIIITGAYTFKKLKPDFGDVL
jgi:ABC-type polysaccharide/polyol phosphate export permease